jgi:hypothetical protein
MKNKCPQPILVNASGPRGADMGRPNTLPIDPKAAIKLHLQLLPIVDGDYDKAGAYWGCYAVPERMYLAFSDNDGMDVKVFVRGLTRAAAKANVRAEALPNATFFN